MKLYSGPLSLFTGKVRIALSEKGGVAAYAVALVPLGIALWLLWARLG